MPTSSTIIEQAANPDTLFDFDYPSPGEHEAICIGLLIDWRNASSLHAAALRYTHVTEHERAARFLRSEDSLRHLLGRALLRKIVGHDDHRHPHHIEPMPVNAWGKPQPTSSSAGCNLSHAGNQVWATLARFPHAGIDVESATAPSEYLGIMRNFHPAEIGALQSLPDMRAAVMRCWTRKEAISKAIGMGLSLPLNAYAVDCHAIPNDWLHVAPSGTTLADWTTMDLPVWPGYVGALAIEGRCNKVTIMKLTCQS
jgi:4'-phosphopantetheinyl transferase